MLLVQNQDVHLCVSSSTSLVDVMTSSVVASVLKRRRPQVTLTLDSALRYSPPASGAGPGQSRRSSASIDSGYGSSLSASPTFSVVDFFSPPPPLRPLRTGPIPCGPLTAPPPSISQSPIWFNHPQPPNPTYSRRPPGFAHPATTPELKNDLYFVFDGLNIRR